MKKMVFLMVMFGLYMLYKKRDDIKMNFEKVTYEVVKE